MTLGTAYLAPPGFSPQLAAELKGVTLVHGDLFVTERPPQRAVWAQNTWFDVERLAVRSITDAATQLKSRQRNWWPYAPSLHRRMTLIQAKLPHIAAKPLVFPEAAPTAPLGSFTLLDEQTLLAAGRCSSPFPNGEPTFKEYKVGPPSRAYLKIFEALTVLRKLPAAGDSCLELGASPGGWTWCIAGLGAAVTAYDRAELAPHVAAMPGVRSVKGDAFSATPDKVGPVDWLFSDVICYPERLLEHIKLWLAADACRNFVCTLKFQGDEHYGAIDEFLKIEGSRVVHLFHNKHELTWAKLS